MGGDHEPGSPVSYRNPDGSAAVDGEVLEAGLRGVHPLGAHALDSLRFAARVERKTR